MTAFANSYVTTDTILEAYIGTDPRAAAVALKTLAATSQEWYVQKATTLIDGLNYAGYEYLDPQVQAWTNGNVKRFPRKYDWPKSVSPWGASTSVDAFGYAYDSASVPQPVIDACCEQAIAIYDEINDVDLVLRRKLQKSGVSSVGFRGRSESYVAGATDFYQGLCQEAYKKLRPFISNVAVIQ
jgi:hypothetical protein